MSGLAGVFWFDGRPAAADDAARLLEHLSHRRGQPESVARGSIAMGSLEEGAVEPSSILTMLDGRIDNRDDLIRTLYLPGDASDRSVVEAAWRRWGSECPLHLIGDFAFTVFDGERLFAARDCAPFRPFFYRPTPTACYWASELAPLVRDDRPAINEGVVAEHLADRLVSLDETLFHGVFRLPPAHAMDVGADGQRRVWRYWSPDPRAEIRYRDQRDYDEHFRTLFREAVRSCLHAHGPVALWYSGGVDSSAVAAQMAMLRDDGEPSIARALETISMSVPGYAEDETPYFTRGAAHFNFPNTVRPFYFGTAADYEEDARATLDLPITPNMMSCNGIWEALVARDIRVTLTGVGGDDWFIGSQFALFDDIRQLRWAAAVQRVRLDRHLQLGFSTRQLLGLGLWLHVPAHARAVLRRTFGWKATPDHIRPSFAARVCLEDRLRASRWTPAYSTFAQADLYGSVMGASVVTARELQARMAARWRVELRHPFEDRRLAEFALAVPADQLQRPGAPRHVVLSALADHLPRAVYSRIDGMDSSGVVGAALLRVADRDRIERLLADLADWLEPTTLRAVARQVETATPVERGKLGGQIWMVWQALSMHLWWKAVQQGN
jgi:asparagine synthase (glutamine-hydrolysing)